MCGIAGVVAADWPRERTESALRRMCDAMVHRGPDDGGVRWESGVGIAMRRLSIVDVAGGHQPLSNEDGTLWIVFNGEIYNAPALRQKLIARGHRFRTRSDTEVVVHLYQDEGLHFADEMRGMWALAIHDTRTGRVVLSRDRMGIKPLFLYTRGERTVFASELRAFRAIGGDLGSGALALDPAAAQAMLSWSYVPGSSTIYRDIRSVEPGTHEMVTLRGAIMRRRYWQLRANPDSERVRTMEEALELTGSELRRAVREHLESDVPVGAFVSGGIDSGLVAAYAAEAAPALSTFAVGFDVPAFDESAHAEEVARRVGSKHVLHRMGNSDVYGALVDVLVRCDGPFGDSSLIATWAVSRLASRTHKVVLSGDGGDEVFAGYVKHSIVRWRDRLHVLPSAPFRAADILLRRMPQSRERRMTDLIRKMHRGVRALGLSPVAGYAALTRVAALEDTASMILDVPADSPFREIVERMFSTAPGDDELSKTLATDIALVLPNDMLAKVDQASMLNSLETRVPMLDHRLVEIGWSLPDRFKLGSRHGKLVLRELFRRRFGDKLAARPKQGFQVPVESWLAGPLEPALAWVFAPDRLARYGVLNPRAFDADRRHALQVHQPLLLWNAFCLAVWCEVSAGDIDESELRAVLGGHARPPSSKQNGGSTPRGKLRAVS
jgi:asparagine synthase (glutamine-hydrolysing)